MFVDCDGGDHEVLIIFDEDLISDVSEADEIVEVTGIYPNPFSDHTNIMIRMEDTQNVKVAVYDIRGSLTAVVFEDQLSKGEHVLYWDGSGLPSGVYHVLVQGESFSASAKVVKR